MFLLFCFLIFEGPYVKSQMVDYLFSLWDLLFSFLTMGKVRAQFSLSLFFYFFFWRGEAKWRRTKVWVDFETNINTCISYSLSLWVSYISLNWVIFWRQRSWWVHEIFLKNAIFPIWSGHQTLVFLSLCLWTFFKLPQQCKWMGNEPHKFCRQYNWSYYALIRDGQDSDRQWSLSSQSWLDLAKWN